MPIELQRIIFLAVDEAIDRLGADPHGANAIGEQTTGDLLRGPKRLQLLDHQFTQLRVPYKLPQTLPPLFADVVSNCWEVAAIAR